MTIDIYTTRELLESNVNMEGSTVYVNLSDDDWRIFKPEAEHWRKFGQVISMLEKLREDIQKLEDAKRQIEESLSLHIAQTTGWSEDSTTPAVKPRSLGRVKLNVIDDWNVFVQTDCGFDVKISIENDDDLFYADIWRSGGDEEAPVTTCRADFGIELSE